MGNLESLETRPVITSGRFWNFRFSLPFAAYLEKKEILLEFANSKCKYLYLQEEMSEKGFHHIQVFFITVNSMSISAVKQALAIQYAWGVSLSDIEREYNYCRKSDSRVVDGVILSIGVPPRTLSSNKELYHALLNFECVDEGMRYLREHDPQTYVLKRQRIESCLLRENRKRVKRDFDGEFLREHVDVKDGLTHIFVGTTGIGKTSYALSHFKKPVLISDRQDFGKIDSSTDGIVIDDFTFKSWLATNVLHVVDVSLDRSINVKYGTANLPGGLPRIITLNDLALFWPNEILPKTRDAIMRRIKIHDFGNEVLYSPTKKIKLDTVPVVDVLPNIVTTDNVPSHLDESISNLPVPSPHCERITSNESVLDLSLFDVPILSPNNHDTSHCDSSCYIVSVSSPTSPSFHGSSNVDPVHDSVFINNCIKNSRFGVDIDDSFDYYRLG